MVYTHVSNAMYGDVKILIFYLYHKQHKLSLQSNLYIQGTVILECDITFLKFLAPATLFFFSDTTFCTKFVFPWRVHSKIGVQFIDKQFCLTNCTDCNLFLEITPLEQFSTECHKTKTKPITYQLDYQANFKLVKPIPQ